MSNKAIVFAFGPGVSRLHYSSHHALVANFSLCSIAHQHQRTVETTHVVKVVVCHRHAHSGCHYEPFVCIFALAPAVFLVFAKSRLGILERRVLQVCTIGQYPKREVATCAVAM